jgi:hypothetical protein
MKMTVLCVLWYIAANIMEDHTVPIFTVEEVPPKYCNPSSKVCHATSQHTAILIVKTPNPTVYVHVL